MPALESENTSPLALPFHADTTAPAPVPDTLARRDVPAPPTCVNAPPRYTFDPTTLIARTVPFAFGFHGSSAPVERLTAATWLRATSPVPAAAPGGRIDVNWPPRYTVLP